MSKRYAITSGAACSRCRRVLPVEYADTPQTAVGQLRFIKRAQDIGFSLAEIKQLLRLERMRGCHDARALASAKLSAVEQRMAALERVRGALRRLVGECDAGGTRSCPIIEALARG